MFPFKRDGSHVNSLGRQDLKKRLVNSRDGELAPIGFGKIIVGGGGNCQWGRSDSDRYQSAMGGIINPV